MILLTKIADMGTSAYSAVLANKATMRKLISLLIILSFTTSCGQKKMLWAKSFINKKAPEVIVEKWLTEKPETNGKFLLIDFWATWCRPCVKGIPDLNEYHHKFSDKLVVIGISNETEEQLARMKNPKIEYYSAIDTKERLKQIYEVKGIPHCVIINPKGIVVWEGYPQQSGFELSDEIIENLINNY
jgi:cytochrome c biogenesis protein CcmG/thiol:disulfide interchange protein DsbE